MYFHSVITVSSALLLASCTQTGVNRNAWVCTRLTK